MHSQRHVKASKFTSAVLTAIFSIVEQNVKIFEACVNHRPYVGKLNKKPCKNHGARLRKEGTGSANMLTHFWVLRLISAALYAFVSLNRDSSIILS